MAEYLRPAESWSDRMCSSTPSSPAVKKRSSKKQKRGGSFRTKENERVSESESDTLTAPPSPPSFLKSIKNKLRSQKLSPTLPLSSSPQPPQPPAIEVFPTEDKEARSEEAPLITRVPLKTEEGKRLVPMRCLRNNPSGSSMESGYSTDCSRQSKASLLSQQSLSSVLDHTGGTADQQHKRVSVDSFASGNSSAHQSRVELIPASPSASCSLITGAPYLIDSPVEARVSNKDRHPNCLFSIGQSDNSLKQIPESVPLNSPLNLPPTAASSSPIESSASSTSSLSSTSCSGSSSRRNSLSVVPSLTPDMGATHPPSSSGSLSLANQHARCWSASVSFSTTTMYCRVTPGKYLKQSRATSDLHLSEVMTDDKMTGRLKKLQISFDDPQFYERDCHTFCEPTQPHTTAATNKILEKMHVSKSLPQELSSSQLIAAGWSPPPFGNCHLRDFVLTKQMEQLRKVKKKLKHESRKREKLQREMKRECDELRSDVSQHLKLCHTQSDSSSSERVCILRPSESVVVISERSRERETCCPTGHARRHSSMPCCFHHQVPPKCAKKLQISFDDRQFCEGDCHATTFGEPTQPHATSGILEKVHASKNLPQDLIAAGLSPPPFGNCHFRNYLLTTQMEKPRKEPSDLPHVQVDSAVIRDLSEELVDWKWPVRALGLGDPVIERIKQENPHNIREQCYQALKRWRDENWQSATYQALGEALHSQALSVYPHYVAIVESFLSRTVSRSQ